ncbi:MAG: hypothetical protein HY840_10260 [Bacteroidetes bacterium]|nr:hypothetical protein [Bacteroidota bacterium]
MTRTSVAPVISPTQKEDVSELHFPREEVLANAEETVQRRLALERAVVLGNTYKGKIKILFKDVAEIKQIETYIWGLTDKRVILKQGTVIPINRILEVRF